MDATPTLFQRLAAFRADLEKVAAELAMLCPTTAQPLDPELAALLEQLRRAAHHLELALDFLMPLGDQSDRPLPLSSQ